MATQDLPLLVEKLEGGLRRSGQKGKLGTPLQYRSWNYILCHGQGRVKRGKDILLWSNPIPSNVKPCMCSKIDQRVGSAECRNHGWAPKNCPTRTRSLLSVTSTVD